ncbi:hypothetical protein IFM89_000829 [Coptis chinensis]|uniref:Uncharacterized protein n=1 Tax=Coptis chinensis TaxID=261450 RepID=A0A835IT22_9MAGN|nr:hypothetical protein IFM89_000829 [Coptis chinensis]
MVKKNDVDMEIEKLKLSEMTCREGVVAVAKILNTSNSLSTIPMLKHTELTHTETDQSNVDTSGYSTLSGNDSFAYCRTSSEISAFPVPTNDNNCADGNSLIPGSVCLRFSLKGFLKTLDASKLSAQTKESGIYMILAGLEMQG